MCSYIAACSGWGEIPQIPFIQTAINIVSRDIYRVSLLIFCVQFSVASIDLVMILGNEHYIIF